jgi:hypothetical protein
METIQKTVNQGPLTATVSTKNASSYLRKLCQHWSHRFPVECNDIRGTIQLPSALCTLDATPETLLVRLDLEEGADAVRLRAVVEEHLQRFGFREELVFVWNPQQA